jgi:hypothetical protein
MKCIFCCRVPLFTAHRDPHRYELQAPTTGVTSSHQTSLLGIPNTKNCAQYILHILSFLFFPLLQNWKGTRESAVGTVTGYGLHDWVGIQVLVEARIFSLHVIQTSSGAHTAPGSFQPEAKAARHEADHSHPTSPKGQENLDPYIHFSICLHAVVLS